MLRASRAHAFVSGREFVVPEDVKTVFAPLAAHRLTLAQGQEGEVASRIDDLLEQVAVN